MAISLGYSISIIPNPVHDPANPASNDEMIELLLDNPSSFDGNVRGIANIFTQMYNCNVVIRSTETTYVYLHNPAGYVWP